GADARGDDQTRQTGEQTGNRVDPDLDAVGIHAGDSRRLLIAAQRINVAAKGHVVEHDVSEDRYGDQDDDREGHTEDLALADEIVFRCQLRQWLVGVD